MSAGVISRALATCRAALGRRRDPSSSNRREGGFSLVDTVITVALLTTISGILVYGVMAMNNIQKDTLTNANAAISSSGLVNSFSNDLEQSKAHRYDESTGDLFIARGDGSCVTWRYVSSESSLFRNVSDPDGTLRSHGVLSDKVKDASFASDELGASVTFTPERGKAVSVRAETKIQQGFPGGCW